MGGTMRWTFLIMAGAGLMGCTQLTGGDKGSTSLQPAPQAAQAPTAAEQACLAAVSKQTNNGDVTKLSSEFSQAGTSVIVGVGPQRARWSCIAYSDGSTADVRSLVNEGNL